MRLGLGEAGSEPGRRGALRRAERPGPAHRARRSLAARDPAPGRRGLPSAKRPGAAPTPAWAGAQRVPRQRVRPELEFGAPTGRGAGCPGAGPWASEARWAGHLQVWGAVCRATLRRREPGRPGADGELFPPRGWRELRLPSDPIFRRLFSKPRLSPLSSERTGKLSKFMDQ